MSLIDRFSVSLDTELLAAFDHHIAARGYTNRSEAVRDLIRDLLVRTTRETSPEPVAAVLSFLCAEQPGDARARVRAKLAAAGQLVRGIMLLPLAEGHEVQAVLLSGPGPAVQDLAQHIEALRGVAHACVQVIPLPAAGHDLTGQRPVPH